jgi:hypothetical protein
MPLEISREKRADRNNSQLALSSECERGADECRPNALAFMGWGNLRVSEHYRAAAQPIFGNREAAVAEIRLEAALLDVVSDCV